MIVGFSGTRSGPTPAQHEAMRRFLQGMPMTRFVHGGARGGDTLAHNIVRAVHRELIIDVYPCNVATDIGACITAPGLTCFTIIWPPAPPLERNRKIVSLIHGLLAVPRTDIEADSGTWATVRYAREIGCPVYVVRQNGKVVRG